MGNAIMKSDSMHFFWQDAYRKHASSVMAFLVGRLRRREDAEDVLQETFVRAIRAEGSLREPDRLRSYLFSIAHNLMINKVRKQGRVLRFEVAPGDDTNLENHADAQTVDPEAIAAFHDLEDRLQTILADLSPRYRQAFELAVLEQESYRSIAEKTGWTLAQVKINVYRARRKAIAGLANLLPEAQERAS